MNRSPRGSAALPAGNVSRIRLVPGDPPELQVSPDPKGTRPLWFYFRGETPKLENSGEDAGKLRLVLEHYETLAGAVHPSECNPLFRADGQWWSRMSRGQPRESADGRVSACWTMNLPEQDFEVALCYPYEASDLKKLTEKKGGGWMREVIGLSQGGAPIYRFANCHERAPHFSHGLFIVARERGCDMPAAWVLDGLLQRLATAKKNPFMTWAIALADPDAARSGAWRSEPDLTGQWQAQSARPEIHAVLADLQRWKMRCEPSLGLSIQAAPLYEVSGITCSLADPEGYKEQHQLALKWANTLRHKLGDFAAADFMRPDAGNEFSWCNGLARSGELCGLTLHIPWCRAGDVVFTPKKYREAGRLIADGLIEKRH